MFPPSWMLARLAIETRIHHATADADRSYLLEHTTWSAYVYREFLRRIYGFEAPFEAALAATPGIDAGLLHARLKMPRLVADLVALGVTQSELSRIPLAPCPAFRSVAHAHGWLYVVERNSLLHGLVLRHLLTLDTCDVKRSSSYLAVYGDTPGARFRELGRAIDRVANAPVIPDQIVAAAGEAYRAQRKWFLLATGERTRIQLTQETGLAS